MKRLSGIMVAALMLVVLATGMQVEAASTCGCGESHSVSGEWTELTADGGSLTSGNYYLAEDVTLTTDLIINTDVEVNLCLNGYVLEGTGTGRVITVYGTLYLYDDADSTNTHVIVDPRSEDPTATIIVTGGVITGGANAGSGGGIYVESGTLNMYGGTIAGNASTYGGGVYLRKSSTFNMYGGTIAYNTAYSGGGVYVYSSTFNMYGGNIIGNTATSLGGGVYVYTSGTFTMEAGTITENVATSNGGGVYTYCASNTLSAMFTMDGGSVTKNVALSTGGGLYMSSYSTATVNGGSITGNSTNVVEGAYSAEVIISDPAVVGETATDYGSITINPSDNGCVNMTSLYPMVGSSVTLMIMPEEGYELDTLSVIDSDLMDVEVTDNAFTMPAGEATITATFKLIGSDDLEDDADDLEDDADDLEDDADDLEDDADDLEDDADEDDSEADVDDSEDETEDDSEEEVPETGDAANLWWFAILGMSVVGMFSQRMKKA